MILYAIKKISEEKYLKKNGGAFDLTALDKASVYRVLQDAEDILELAQNYGIEKLKIIGLRLTKFELSSK